MNIGKAFVEPIPSRIGISVSSLHVSSRTMLWFDVVNSPSLSSEQKEMVMRRLATRIGEDGVPRVILRQTRDRRPIRRRSPANAYVNSIVFPVEFPSTCANSE
ncbi:MAG: hypothetical protein ABFD97_01480 [Syntrophobacter sp.]